MPLLLGLSLNPKPNIYVYKVLYSTTRHNGEQVVASGAVFIPQLSSQTPLRMAVYGHGTSFRKGDVPSAIGSMRLFS